MVRQKHVFSVKTDYRDGLIYNDLIFFVVVYFTNFKYITNLNFAVLNVPFCTQSAFCTLLYNHKTAFVLNVPFFFSCFLPCHLCLYFQSMHETYPCFT